MGQIRQNGHSKHFHAFRRYSFPFLSTPAFTNPHHSVRTSDLFLDEWQEYEEDIEFSGRHPFAGTAQELIQVIAVDIGYLNGTVLLSQKFFNTTFSGHPGRRISLRSLESSRANGLTHAIQ